VVLVTALVGTGFGFPRLHGRSAGHKLMYQAATRGDATRLAQIIRENPEDVRAADAKGNTALHLVALHDHLDAARVLLGAGAQVNARNGDGMTPLMVAAKSGSLEVVKLLLKRGADTTITDMHGWTASKWAQKTHRDQIAILIASSAVTR